MTKHFYISLLFIFICSASIAQRKDKNKELQGQALDDAHMLSAEDYPYLDKFYEALRLKYSGNDKEAIELFKECLELRPNDDAVLFALGQLELKNGISQVALRYFERAEEVDPDNIWYTQEIAYLYFEKERFAKAAVSFKKMVEYEPKNVDWLYGYAQCLILSGEYEKSIAVFNQMETQIGKVPELTLRKVEIYRLLEQPEKMISELKSALPQLSREPQVLATLFSYYLQTENIEGAKSDFEEMAEFDPDNGYIQLFLADIYSRTDQKEEMLKALNSSFNNIEVGAEQKIQMLISLDDEGDLSKEVTAQLADTLLKSHPDDSGVLLLHAEVNAEAGNLQKALSSYKKSLEIDASLYSNWIVLLKLEAQMGAFQDLYTDGNTALERFPNMPQIYLYSAHGALRTGKPEEASSFLEIGEDFILADNKMKAKYNELRGQILFSEGSYKEGQLMFEKAMEQDPENLYIPNNYAYQLSLQNIQIEKALKLAEKSLDKYPENPYVLDTYGMVLFRKKQYTEAANYLKQALDKAPEDGSLLDHYGDILYHQKKVDEAVKYWIKAKNNNVANSVINQKIDERSYYEPKN